LQPFLEFVLTLKSYRRRGESSSTIPKTEEAPQIEEGEEHEESEQLTAPFPDVLTDISLLQSFKSHVGVDIWNGDVRF